MVKLPNTRDSVEAAVQSWLDTLELDELGRARAAAAIALAESLDLARQGETGVIMQAIPQMVKGLREALAEIAEATEGDDPLLTRLNADDD